MKVSNAGYAVLVIAKERLHENLGVEKNNPWGLAVANVIGNVFMENAEADVKSGIALGFPALAKIFNSITDLVLAGKLTPVALEQKLSLVGFASEMEVIKNEDDSEYWSMCYFYTIKKLPQADFDLWLTVLEPITMDDHTWKRLSVLLSKFSTRRPDESGDSDVLRDWLFEV